MGIVKKWLGIKKPKKAEKPTVVRINSGMSPEEAAEEEKRKRRDLAAMGLSRSQDLTGRGGPTTLMG